MKSDDKSHKQLKTTIEVSRFAPHSLIVLISPFAHPISHPRSQFAVSNASLWPD